MRKLLQNEQGHWNARIIAGIFGLLQLRAANAPAEAPPAPALAVEIEGPAEAPLGEETYFTLISENACLLYTSRCV